MPIITAQAPLPVTKTAEPAAQAVETTRQLDTTEAPKEVSQEAGQSEEDQQLSPKFAALARKERALRSRIQELKAKEDSLKAMETEYQSTKSFKDKLSANPLEALSELGITYDQLTNLLLNQPQQANPEVLELRRQLKSLEESQNKQSKYLEEQQKQQYETAVAQIRNEAKVLVDSDPATFELIKSTESVEAVVELIKEHFNETQEVMSVQEAANQVEEYLLNEALKYAKFNKVQGKLKPAEAVAETTAAQKQAPQLKQQSPITTLSNQVTASSTKPLTQKERRERAIAAFKGQLK